MRLAPARWIAPLSLALLAGCVTPPRPFNVPSGPYGDSLARDTRSVSVYKGIDAMLYAYVTDETTGFRHARADRLAEVFHMTPAEAELHGGDLTDSLGPGRVFFVAVNTSDRNANDLERATSQWSVSLAGADGAVQPKEIVRLSAKPVAVQSLYPYLDRFFVPYRIVFPPSVGTGPITLVIGGPQGQGRMSFEGEAPAP